MNVANHTIIAGLKAIERNAAKGEITGNTLVSVISAARETLESIDFLREEEGSSVGIVSDNGDFNREPECKIVCTGEWTHWEEREICGSTVLVALRCAVEERRKWLESKADAAVSDSEPIHEFFGLSYASYLVIPRSLLQSCKVGTQRRLRAALDLIYQEEQANLPHHWPDEAKIEVRLKDAFTGKYIADPCADYQRGRRRLW